MHEDPNDPIPLNADDATELIPANAIPKHVPGRRPNVNTTSRWYLLGVGSPPIKLATVKIGGRRYTTRAAIAAFIAATSAQRGASATTVSDGRAAAVRKAEHELDADGIAD